MGKGYFGQPRTSPLQLRRGHRVTCHRPLWEMPLQASLTHSSTGLTTKWLFFLQDLDVTEV